MRLALQYTEARRTVAAWWRRSATWPRKAPQNYRLQRTSAILVEAIAFNRLSRWCATASTRRLRRRTLAVEPDGVLRPRSFSMFKLSVVLVSVAVVVAAGPSSSAACATCSCAPPDAPRIALDSSAAVFRAHVVALEDRPIPLPDLSAFHGKARQEAEWVYLRQALERLRVTLAVTQVWKGDVAHQIDIYTPNECCICGFPFELGKEYLVYAHGLPSGRLGTTICSRTRSLSRAREDLDALGPGAPPSNPPADSTKRPQN